MELTRRIGIIKEGSVVMSDFLEVRRLLVDMRLKLLVCVKLDLTHRPPPSRVDLLKVAHFRCAYSLFW